MISIVIGNLLALLQTNIKRMMGYSSISHFGYLLVAVIVASKSRPDAGGSGRRLSGHLMYLFTSLGAFGVISMMSDAPISGK